MEIEYSDQQVLRLLRSELGEDMILGKIVRPKRILVILKKGPHLKAIEILLRRFDGTGLSTITAIDRKDTIELNYHFHVPNTAVTLRISVPAEEPDIETMVNILPGANLYEREVFDLLGVNFLGHPNLERLLLPENWKSDIHPLRKDWNSDAARKSKKRRKHVDSLRSEGEIITVPFGPQHPALHEPERFLLRVEGERVVGVEPRIGYVHRGIEKLAESLTFLQDIYLVERICGICNTAHTLCFCRAIETIGGVEIPERASFLRLIAFELNRVQSHLLLLGVGAYELGFESLFMYVWRDREMAMRLMEELTGNRVLSGFNTIGGVRRDLRMDQEKLFRSFIPKLRERAVKYRSVFDDDPTLRARTQGVGILSNHDVTTLSAVGPVARCSGVKSDLRVEEPFFPFDEVPFFPVFYDDGDSWSRLKARVDEILVSLDMIQYAVENLPSGAIRMRIPLRFPEGEALSRVEAPRGELVHFVRSNGTVNPERLKVRSPTLANILSLCKSLEGCNIADLPASIVSMDPCFSCTDRMAFVDLQGGKRWSWSIHDIQGKYWR